MEDGQHTHNPAQGDELRGEAETAASRAEAEGGVSPSRRSSSATKIRKRYITGLEHEDYEMYPYTVYARGFLKTYANYLGLDGEALSQQIKNSTKSQRERGSDYDPRPESDFEKPLITPSGLRGTQKRTISTSAIVTLIVAVLALAAVIAALYFVGRGVQASNESNPPSGETPPRQERQNVADTEKAHESGWQRRMLSGAKASRDDGDPQARAECST